MRLPRPAAAAPATAAVAAAAAALAAAALAAAANPAPARAASAHAAAALTPGSRGCHDQCAHPGFYPDPSAAGGYAVEYVDLTNDGLCDDGGPGAGYSNCDYGFDCTDCGARTWDCGFECTQFATAAEAAATCAAKEQLVPPVTCRQARYDLTEEGLSAGAPGTGRRLTEAASDTGDLPRVWACYCVESR